MHLHKRKYKINEEATAAQRPFEAHSPLIIHLDIISKHIAVIVSGQWQCGLE